MSEYRVSESSTRVASSRLGQRGDIAFTHDHNIEFMGPDGGPYEFYYDYEVFRFEQGMTAVTARSYRDEPAVASFTGVEVNGNDRLLERDDFRLPLVRAAVHHLRTIGKQDFQWLDPSSTEGYSPIPPVAVVDA